MVRQPHPRRFFPQVWLVLLGLISLFWLIFRSGRKPSRLQYPCQKIAAANSLGFLSWLASVFGGHWFYRQTKNLGKKILLIPILALLVFSGAKYYQVWQREKLWREAKAQGTSSKVVRIKNSSATDGQITNTYFAQSSHFNQSVIDNMMNQAIMTLTSTPNTNQAWSQLFSRISGHDYQSGEVIAIKLNNNNDGVDGEQEPLYQTANSLIRQLVAKGVPAGNIYVYDASRVFGAYFKSGINSGVKIYEANNATWDGGSVAGVNLCGLLKQATYLVNMPLLRTYGGWDLWTTVSFKNHFGSTSDPYSLGNHEGSSNTGWGQDLVAINSHPNIAKKTVLVVVDGLYAITTGAGPHNLPNSAENTLILGTDPVAVDSRVFDYFGVDGSYYLPLAQQSGLGSMNYQEVFCNPNCPGITPQPSLSPSNTPTPLFQKGDINLDHQVNAADALLLFSLYRKPTWLAIYAPDPDRDGLPTLADYGYIIRDWGH